jgi:hypothetical protein
MLQVHEVEVAVLVAEEPAGASAPGTLGHWGLATSAGTAGVSGRTTRTSRMSRLLNVVDVAVALPALISAMAVWGVVTGTGRF